MTGGLVTIQVPLLDVPSEAWRPVQAWPRDGGAYEIATRNDDPLGEPWLFPPGSLVRCEARTVQGREFLVAVELLRPRAPRLVR